LKIQVMHSFLVYPDKGAEEQTPIKGTEVTDDEDLLRMLRGIFDAAPRECKFEISFSPNAEGKQQNDCRDLIVDYIDGHSKVKARKIAERLQAVTTHRSGLGLLFFILGQDGKTKRLVISRFPAEQGVAAREEGNTLTVEFIKQIFMKSATAYKSVMYEGKAASDFWIGRAIDKQIGADAALSSYWIRDFLASDFAVAGARGTRRLALAIRNAAASAAEPSTKEELASAAKLAVNLEGKIMSGALFVEKYDLSDHAREQLQAVLHPQRLYEEQFRFSREEFEQHIKYRSVELSNGATLTAEFTKFDQVFAREHVGKTDKVRFTTEGEVVDDKLRKGQ
jgi:hypothetical protein